MIFITGWIQISSGNGCNTRRERSECDSTCCRVATGRSRLTEKGTQPSRQHLECVRLVGQQSGVKPLGENEHRFLLERLRSKLDWRRVHAAPSTIWQTSGVISM